MSAPLRIANCSGFYGDRLAAAREMITGGPIDFLTGDYLAELTMMILWKARQKDSSRGYAATFLKQMEDVLGEALDRGIKIVTNAGGLNPAGLSAELRALCDRLGLKAKIAHIEGDDLMPQLESLVQAGHALKNLDTGRPLSELRAKPLSANAYLGAWGIVEALKQGADVVVCPRVTDASVVVGPAAWHFRWQRTDWDRLAGAVAAGHVVECGAQCTGGNYAFFQEVPGLEHPGFPIAEIAEDGSSVITKHPGTGGLVSVGTVTAQLLYETDTPKYLNPDVAARFDTIELAQEGPDRVRMSGVRGEPAPPTVKVCLNYLGGYRNQMTFVLVGLDIEQKAALVERTLRRELDENSFDTFAIDLARTDKPDALTNHEAAALLKVTVKSHDAKRVDRAFSGPIIEMVLSSYPGLFCTTPPSEAQAFGVYWPTLVPASVPRQEVVLEDGTRIPIEPTAAAQVGTPIKIERSPLPAVAAGPTRRAALGTLFGARSGDKGGNANVGVWARDKAGYAWLASFLTVERFRHLIPEAAHLEIRRFELPNLNALNFVVVGLLGEGVASSLRFDPQAKSLGEYLRSRVVDLPG
ncbi:MAG TPA: acyclic terpene utilization AtuA family protein [Pirellulales bacterium]|nr:acyclic terpene utilization AtuA family protein [Pirellulales bacterium]